MFDDLLPLGRFELRVLTLVFVLALLVPVLLSGLVHSTEVDANSQANTTDVTFVNTQGTIAGQGAGVYAIEMSSREQV